MCLGNNALACIKNSIARRTRAVIFLLYSALMRLCLVLGPSLKNNIEVLKHIQRRATGLVKGLENISYEEWLRQLNLFSLENRRLRGMPFLSTTP